MNKNQRVVSDFLDQISRANTVDEMFDVLESAMINLEFENISYTFVPELLARALTRASPVFKLSKNYNTAFIDHYTEANFGAHDFTIRRIIEGETKPIVWWDEAKHRRLSSEEREIIEVARAEYGFRHGVTISAYCDGSSMAGISLTNRDHDQDFHLLLKERLGIAQQISRLFNDHLFRKPEYQVIFLMPVLKKLSSTEVSVLAGLSQGKNIKRIADELKISERYVNNTIIRNLKNKLGCISRDQLMYQAGKIQFGNIAPLLDRNDDLTIP